MLSIIFTIAVDADELRLFQVACCVNKVHLQFGVPDEEEVDYKGRQEIEQDQ